VQDARDASGRIAGDFVCRRDEHSRWGCGDGGIQGGQGWNQCASCCRR
jgi:hypothetical protein